MDALYHAINTTPIIDNHAHNLLLPHELAAREFISITTEAGDGALKATPSSLSHLRAVKQLSQVLGCDAEWDAVQAAILKRRKDPREAWAKRCFEGIETVLIDDGLDASTVHSWEWHDRLTRSPCKRILRIENLAETILNHLLQQEGQSTDMKDPDVIREWGTLFSGAIKAACKDPNVVGFKSVICYRTGLAIPPLVNLLINANETLKVAQRRLEVAPKPLRLEDEYFSPWFVHMAAAIIRTSGKPLQFHTGLGDNDITLSLSTPSLLQPFIKEYPDLQIVLLHASYPFTREAGYLASVYENVYLDIGEVFPMVSQDGQENIVRESLELCPSEKLCWSTDGHWFPETYLLAVIQVRQALTAVLETSVTKKSMTIPQAIEIVEDILFNTSNRLYKLNLPLTPLTRRSTSPSVGEILYNDPLREISKLLNSQKLHLFLAKYPSVKYLRTQWLDFTATPRTRIIPIEKAVSLLSANKTLSITKAALGLLQNDIMVEKYFSSIGEYKLEPCLESLRQGERHGYATVQGEFWGHDGREVSWCPRTALRRVVQRASTVGIEFLIGFELEVVFLKPVLNLATNKQTYHPLLNGGSHAWSSSSALRDPDTMTMIEDIVAAMQRSEIDLQQWHPESAPGQYEFVTGPLPPLDAVDTLIASREIIFAAAAKHGLKATFVPKPYSQSCGTGAHIHLSLTPEIKHQSFYAGVLRNLRKIVAYTYAGAESYDRVADSCWSGGRYVCWGTQNRETPLRKIEGSHWEFKSMDGLANAYIAVAAILESGLSGVDENLEMTLKDCKYDPALIPAEVRRDKLGITEMLPESLAEALDILEEDNEENTPLLRDVYEKYLVVKRAEIAMLDKMSAEDRKIFMIEHY